MSLNIRLALCREVVLRRVKVITRFTAVHVPMH